VVVTMLMIVATKASLLLEKITLKMKKFTQIKNHQVERSPRSD